MARQTGIIKIKGTIGDVSFYKTQDGHLARGKGGVEKERIMNDPAFVRTRENGAEFSTSAVSGKVLRDAIRPMLLTASDNRVVARLTTVMTNIKNLDVTSVRGKRNIGVAIGLATAKALLKGFNFNKRAILGSILFNPYSVNTGTGVITINGLIPMTEIAYPKGATHLTLRAGWARINFATNAHQFFQTNATNLIIDGTSSNIVLTPTAIPTGVGTDIFLLQVEFFQLVNGVQYSLKDGAHNSLCAIEVV